MKITDIKHDNNHLRKMVVDAGYEVTGQDAIIGRTMVIVASQYLEHVIQATHLATINTETEMELK